MKERQVAPGSLGPDNAQGVRYTNMIYSQFATLSPLSSFQVFECGDLDGPWGSGYERLTRCVRHATNDVCNYAFSVRRLAYLSFGTRQVGRHYR